MGTIVNKTSEHSKISSKINLLKQIKQHYVQINKILLELTRYNFWDYYRCRMF